MPTRTRVARLGENVGIGDDGSAVR